VIREAALGFALVVTFLLTACGVVVTDEAPTDDLKLSAPALVEAYPEVEALAPVPTRTLSLAHARRVARRAALRLGIPACDDDSTGRSFALDSHTLITHRDLLPGAGWVRVWQAGGHSTAVGAASAYRLGDLAVARVSRRLPRKLTVGRSILAGASVVVVAERRGKLRMLPGVVVDAVPGARYGARTKVLRVAFAVRKSETGPVLDANGRIVAAMFAVDPRTTLGLAIPAAALRGRGAVRTLEALPACKD
jgi:hypothetical protein